MPFLKSEWMKLADYVGATYPGTSLGFNAAGQVANISNEDQTQEQFDIMVADLMAKHPSVFATAVSAAPVLTPVLQPVADQVSGLPVIDANHKACTECGEAILAVAKKCRFCLSPQAPDPLAITAGV